ncbi:MAG: DUF2279 domain-containing protein [Bacteroidetes bacterium]|nr:DUF2279 domain-containing protein [Bacteroidota bacterium]
MKLKRREKRIFVVMISPKPKYVLVNKLALPKWPVPYCNRAVITFILSLFFFNSMITGQDTASAIPVDTTAGFQFAPGMLVKKVSDSTRINFRLSPDRVKKRVWLVAGANVVGYSGAMIGLSQAWYKNYPKSKLHSFNDMPEWKQVDKVGHMYSAYIESRASMELWRWTGIDRKKRIWIGGMSGAVYQTVIEVLDGYSAGWGWSWADFGANILGSSVLVAQELAWDDQRIKLKFSFHRKRYDDPTLNQRSDVLFGKSSPERFLKDYNGQTYWASANIKSFFPKSTVPAWLCVAVGYGAEGMFGGTENIARDANGSVTFNRTDIKRYRQWYLAPDIDLSKIKTRSKALNFVLTVLSAFKFPAPSLEFSNGKFRLNAIHF